MALGSVSTERTDVFSLAVLSVLRVFRSVAAGLINVMFPFLVLIGLYGGALGGNLVLGLIYFVATAASAAFGLLLGFAADIVGRKRSYLVALAMLPVSTAILLVSQALPALFVAAAIGGFAATGSLAGGGVGGVAAPIQSALMTDLTSRHDRTFYFGLLAFLSGIASAAGAFAVTFLSEVVILYVATVFGTISFVLALFLHEGAKPSRGRPMQTKKVIGEFSLTGILNGLSQGLLTPFLIPFFITMYHIQDQTVMAPYVALSGLVASFSLLLAPYIERALGFLGSIYLTRGGTILIALAFPFVQILPVSLAFYCIFPSLRVMAVPVQQSAMMDMVDAGERGRAFGINQASRLVFSSAGTAFTGYEFQGNFIAVPFLLYAAVMLGNLFLYHRFFRGYKSPESLTATTSARGVAPDDPPPPKTP